MYNMFIYDSYFLQMKKKNIQSNLLLHRLNIVQF